MKVKMKPKAQLVLVAALARLVLAALTVSNFSQMQLEAAICNVCRICYILEKPVCGFVASSYFFLVLFQKIIHKTKLS